MDTDVASLFWFAVPGILVPGVLLVLAFRSPTWKQMTRWATQAQVTITTHNDDMIRDRLGRARRYRSLVSLPFWWIFALPTILTKPLPGWIDGAAWIPLTGYMLGSMLAAVSQPEKPGNVRAAELSPRLPSRYAQPRARLAPWLVLSTAIILFGLAKAFPPMYALSVRAQVPQLLTAVAVAALAEVALRVIGRQPQMTGSATRRAADDALRSTGATAAVASAIMMSLITLGSAIRVSLGSGQRAWVGLPAMVIVGGLTYIVFAAIITQQPWAPTWRRPLQLTTKTHPDPTTKSVGA